MNDSEVEAAWEHLRPQIESTLWRTLRRGQLQGCAVGFAIGWVARAALDYLWP